jgi:hypothetical protein
MNILDENMPESQRRVLKKMRIIVKKIGIDLGRRGFDDEDIIPLLHQLNRPTFFTLDFDYSKRRLRHDGYCLVYLDIDDYEAAEYIRRVLRHPALNTKAKRMGKVIRVEPSGMTIWRTRHDEEEHLAWNE